MGMHCNRPDSVFTFTAKSVLKGVEIGVETLLLQAIKNSIPPPQEHLPRVLSKSKPWPFRCAWVNNSNPLVFLSSHCECCVSPFQLGQAKDGINLWWGTTMGHPRNSTHSRAMEMSKFHEGQGKWHFCWNVPQAVSNPSCSHWQPPERQISLSSHFFLLSSLQLVFLASLFGPGVGTPLFDFLLPPVEQQCPALHMCRNFCCGWMYGCGCVMIFCEGRSLHKQTAMMN